MSQNARPVLGTGFRGRIDDPLLLVLMIYSHSLQIFNIRPMPQLGLPVGSNNFSRVDLLPPVLGLLLITQQVSGDQEGVGIEGESDCMVDVLRVEMV